MQNAPAKKAQTQSLTIDWKTYYNALSAPYKSHQERQMVLQMLCGECKMFEKVIKAVESDRSRMKSDSLEAYTEVLSNLSVYVPMDRISEAQQAYESLLRQFYTDKHIHQDFAAIRMVRFKLVQLRDPGDVIWFWATVFAHLAITSMLDPKCANARESTFVNAMITGNRFTNFVYMIMTVDAVTELLPPILRAHLQYYITTLNDEFQGLIDPNFIIF